MVDLLLLVALGGFILHFISVLNHLPEVTPLTAVRINSL
jgi:hypothetical protein